MRTESLFLLLALVLAAGGCRRQRVQRFPDETSARRAWIDPEAKPLLPEGFDKVSEGRTLGEILSLLGPAQADVGSGLHIMTWRCTDGRRFMVGTGDWRDLTQPPAYAKWEK